MSYSVEIYEDEHFYKSYEDLRNNLYILYLADEVEAWCEEHVKNDYDMYCEDYYMERDSHAVSMEFENERDAFAFEMEWIHMTIDTTDFTVYDLATNQDIPVEKIKWLTGLIYSVDFNTNFKEHAQFRDWCLENCSNKIVFVEKLNPPLVENRTMVYCYDETDATAIKLRWV